MVCQTKCDPLSENWKKISPSFIIYINPRQTVPPLLKWLVSSIHIQHSPFTTKDIYIHISTYLFFLHHYACFGVFDSSTIGLLNCVARWDWTRLVLLWAVVHIHSATCLPLETPGGHLRNGNNLRTLVQLRGRMVALRNHSSGLSIWILKPMNNNCWTFFSFLDHHRHHHRRIPWKIEGPILS